jgi:hypothetical protein
MLTLGFSITDNYVSQWLLTKQVLGFHIHISFSICIQRKLKDVRLENGQDYR